MNLVLKANWALQGPGAHLVQTDPKENEAKEVIGDWLVHPGHLENEDRQEIEGYQDQMEFLDLKGNLAREEHKACMALRVLRVT